MTKARNSYRRGVGPSAETQTVIEFNPFVAEFPTAVTLRCAAVRLRAVGGAAGVPGLSSGCSEIL